MMGSGRVVMSMDGPPTPRSMPKLRLPAGVGSYGVNFDMDGHAMQSNVRVDASGPPGELVAHLAKQLEGGGWTLGAATTTKTMAVQTAQKREADGQELFAVLSATIVPGTTERDLVFRMMWPTSPRR